MYEHGQSTPLPGVRVEVPGDTREAFALRRALEEAFPVSPGAPVYRLQVASIGVTRQPALIQRDGRAARYTTVVRVPYVVLPAASDAALIQDSATAYGSYSVPDSNYAAFVAEREAVHTALRQAAETMRARVLTLSRP